MNCNQQLKPAFVHRGRSTAHSVPAIKSGCKLLFPDLHRRFSGTPLQHCLPKSIYYFQLGFSKIWIVLLLKKHRHNSRNLINFYSSTIPEHQITSLLMLEPRNTILCVLAQHLITSFCYESLIFCSQRVALFPLDVLLPHVHLLSLLGGVLGGDRGSVAVQAFHHCLIFLKQAML